MLLIAADAIAVLLVNLASWTPRMLSEAFTEASDRDKEQRRPLSGGQAGQWMSQAAVDGVSHSE